MEGDVVSATHLLDGLPIDDDARVFAGQLVDDNVRASEILADGCDLVIRGHRTALPAPSSRIAVGVAVLFRLLVMEERARRATAPLTQRAALRPPSGGTAS